MRTLAHRQPDRQVERDRETERGQIERIGKQRERTDRKREIKRGQTEKIDRKDRQTETKREDRQVEKVGRQTDKEIERG